MSRVIGGGPAGLMAAEALAAGGARVDVYDAMPSVGRKFLMAGKGGMNLTHSEPPTRFSPATARAARRSRRCSRASTPDALRAWVHGLGVETFVGSSGRVFPHRHESRADAARVAASAARGGRAFPHAASLARLGRRRHGAHPRFATPDGEQLVRPTPSCSRWAAQAGRASVRTAPGLPLLAARGVPRRAARAVELRFRRRTGASISASRFAGEPLKSVAIGSPRVDGTPRSAHRRMSDHRSRASKAV